MPVELRRRKCTDPLPSKNSRIDQPVAIQKNPTKRKTITETERKSPPQLRKRSKKNDNKEINGVDEDLTVRPNPKPLPTKNSVKTSQTKVNKKTSSQFVLQQ